MKQIIFAHQYNDTSGSPRVLASVIEAVRDSHEALLFVGSAGDGILSSVDIPTVKFWYPRTTHRLLNAVMYFLSQAHLLLRLLWRRDIASDALIYVNTVLPFGAALYGFLTRRKVVYHLHEVSITPRILMRLLVGIANTCGTRFIYVSRFHMDALPVRPERSVVLTNSVDKRLYRESLKHPARDTTDGTFTILMLASLRDYKGVPELVRLAAKIEGHRHVRVQLVANAAPAELAEYLAHLGAPANLEVHGTTSTPEAFYVNADLVLNLSRVDQWIETFGLTLIEAMSFGVPVIAPPVGGPCEIVRDGIDGYLVDSRDEERLHDVVERMIADPQLVRNLGDAARARAKQYAPQQFHHQLHEILKIA